jgi:predicted ATPase
MALTFQLYGPGISEIQSPNMVYLHSNNWDDYGRKTLFFLTVFDEYGHGHKIGNVKIGFVGQDEGWTKDKIPQKFDSLPQEFYSLGQDADYYKNLIESFSDTFISNILTVLGDVTHNPERFEMAKHEGAFHGSLLRSVDLTSIENQFKRILRREAPLTKYNFFYEKQPDEYYSGVKVEFTVAPYSKPSSNIHILIGRNGVGKTTLLNNMVDSLLSGRSEEQTSGYFAIPSLCSGSTELSVGYFAGLVSVSFSAFDPFIPHNNQPHDEVSIRYYYVGLKKWIDNGGEGQWALKDKKDLSQDFTKSLELCFSLSAKRGRWINAVEKLESDLNFAEMDLCQLVNVYDGDLSDTKNHFSERAARLFERMSSGHAIVLLTISKLVETVEEKTLVLLDEPESHLHPPLLSAFTRALSDLLINRNGVAIIATHSPVVLQEVPKSCVSILRRTRLIADVDRPENETFAENVGVLTREVFGLEVSKSGFHDLLGCSVGQGHSYEEIVEEYRDQLGFEGKAILRSMVAIRDSQGGG